MREKLLSLMNEMLEESGKPLLTELKGDLRDDLQMDSLMLAELTVRIESLFGIDVFEDGIVRTLGEIITKLDVS